jgi:hypothetical protein
LVFQKVVFDSGPGAFIGAAEKRVNEPLGGVLQSLDHHQPFAG